MAGPHLTTAPATQKRSNASLKRRHHPMNLDRILQEFKSKDEVTRAHAKEAFQQYVFNSSGVGTAGQAGGGGAGATSVSNAAGGTTSASHGGSVVLSGPSAGSSGTSGAAGGTSTSTTMSVSGLVSSSGAGPGAPGGRIDPALLSRCITLCSSTEVLDKLAGVSAIDAFCDILAADEINSAHKLAANVLKALPCSDPFVMALAAKTYARLASIGELLMVGPVTIQLKQSIEWLQGERIENRRWAGVLLVRELARTVPNLLYEHLSDLTDNVWYALRDAKVAIREAAAGALDGILKIAYDRDAISDRSIPHYQVTYQEACKSFASPAAEHVHGALLGYQELFLRAGLYMKRHYESVCRAVLSILDHKDVLVRTAVTNLLPVLAQYDPQTFQREHYHKAMMHLLSLLRQPKDKERAFDAIGLIAIAVGQATGPYLDAILAACRENLQQNTKASVKKQAASEGAVFLCIARLGVAVGAVLQKHMHDLFDLMFNYGLSDALVEALAQLSHNIPSLLEVTQTRLLDLISGILAGEPFRKYWGIHGANTPATTAARFNPQTPLSALTSASSHQVNGVHHTEKDPGTVCLALDTLGTFDFSKQQLTDFVSSVVVQYLDDDTPAIRLSAVRTTARLMASGPAVKQTSAHSVKLVSEVLDKLLSVAVADPEASIRRTTLVNLDPNFDKHLAQSDKIRSLWVAMNDEHFGIREAAMGVLGRLAAINPAYIMPTLRKTLIQLLTEIEYALQDQDREQATVLLNQLISTSNRITKPYVIPMLKVLLPKAHDRNPDVATAMMQSLGSLAKVGGEDVMPKLGEYMELIVDTIAQQASPGKREAALKALGQLCGASGYVVQPWLDYPNLLGIFINLMQSESRLDVKREAVRTMGIIGALDPYRYTAVLEKQASEHPPAEGSLDLTSNLDHSGPSSDDAYSPAVAFRALLSILRDPSLSAHHTAVVEAIMYIFRSLRLRCVQYLPHIIPALLGAMRSCPPRLEEYYIQNLGHLIAFVKQHIRPHLEPVLALINHLWATSSNLQTILVELMESIARALGGEFKIYVPQLLPLVLQAFESDVSVSDSRRAATQIRVLKTFGVFGTNLEEYLQLVLPSIVRAFERPENAVTVRKTAIGCVGLLCRKMNLSEHASRVVHPLARVLASNNVELRRAAMDALCALITQIDSDFVIFVPMVNKAVVKNKIQHAGYDMLVNKLIKGEPLPQDYGLLPPGSDETDPAADAGTLRLPVNQQNLKSAWDTTGRLKADDWREWLNRLAVQMLKSSSSLSLRACANLAEVYQPLARELFNAAFVSCWTELFNDYQSELAQAIETALSASSVPSEVQQALLNLAEFMEHDEKTLHIHVAQLATYAYHTHAYAKALHYRELEFFSSSSYEVVESLISITNHLHQRDAAMGLLKFAQKQFDMTDMSAEWYEKLERWDDAYAAYEKQAELEPDSFSNAFGRMKCLHALGEWDALASLAQDHWGRLVLDNKRKIAPIAAAAAWGLQEWDMMDEFVSVMKHDSADRAWFRSVLYVHRGSYSKAQNQLNKARDTLINELASLTGESYGRGYSQVIRVQAMAELEEIIQYKMGLGSLPDSRERRSGLYKTWMKRLKGCEQDVDVWQRLLKVRALILTPRDSMDMWIKFANLCRKSGRMTLAEKTLNSLMGGEEIDFSGGSSQGPPHVIYAHLKFMWARGDKGETLAYLDEFTARLAHDLGIGAGGNRSTELTQSGQVVTFTRLLARCFYKQAAWSTSLQDDWGSEYVTTALAAYKQATILDPSWYKAWHSWALANSEVVNHYLRNRPESDQEPVPHEIFTGYLVPAVEAFFKSIALSKDDALQDTLRVLTLWFNHGHQSDVSLAVQQGFGIVSVDTWLDVIPQLIARIHVPSQNVRRLVQQILVDVGKAHPQALIYALTVASKYPSAPRRRAALNTLERMRDHSATLVDQGIMVSQELMRVAILWHEMWHECLEEASRLYFTDHNIEGMFATLEPMHELLERGPETLREIAFEQMFGRDLHDARLAGRRFRAYGEISDLNTAWELYYGVFRKIVKLLPQITQVELEYASPRLLNARDLELAVPGTYHAKRPVIRIMRFAPSFDVLTSKQRPRKIKIYGSDGREHPFLLKGHEDLRQDERVMQLYGLCNTLLSKDPATFKRHLWVQKYPAVPLSPNSGLLGWLPYTDTLHMLIKEYRENRKILINIEQRLMHQMAPDYEHLCLMQKIEVFQYALDNTTGQDLYRILWLRSKNSEAWLDRRSNYSRSLAVSSMVGYILGLGDRHPSNMLLSRENGTVIHIDYGDCFEVAMARDKYPEKVPFRLTRMLQNAMDVSRIEGVFRTTCEHTMRVLRDNKDSIIAVLEAFSRDPLINWRLVTGGRKVEPTPNQTRVENQGPGYRRPRQDESTQMDDDATEVLNQKALQVVERVTQKLTGRDFRPNTVHPVEEQVDLLIKQATALEHLATAFVGWCAFW